jgi:penicillin-binding protein 2
MRRHPFQGVLITLLVLLGASLPVRAQGDPAQVVTSFLAAWAAQDYTAMYNLLSDISREQYTQPVFQEIYAEAGSEASIESLSFALLGSRVQGTSAAVTYDLTLVSPIFGTITDAGRTMRLVSGSRGWGVAWSSMDIFDGMTAGSRLEVSRRRLPRGEILDRNGLALVEAEGTIIPLFGSKNTMFGVEECLDLLASVFRRQRYDLVNRFQPFAPETIFYLGVIDSETQALRGQELIDTCGTSGSDQFSSSVRRYVLGGGAVHLTGYVGQIPAERLPALQAQGYGEGDLIGISGVEQQYERELAGQAEQVLQVVSANGIVIRSIGSKEGSAPVDVRLTVDRELQRAVSEALLNAFNYAEPNWAAPGIASGAGLVVLDVNTGAVLAMASYPFFDPYLFVQSQIPDRGLFIGELVNDQVRRPLSDRALQDQYFPGSTFKIITTAAAVAEGVMPEPTFFCDLSWDGRQQYGDTSSPRSDWRILEPPDSKYYQTPAGDVTPELALAASCNPFFYEMGARLFTQRGPNLLADFARRMGLGGPTGLAGFPEAAGRLQNPTSVESNINIAIGQEVQVTVLQMARMVAGVANGGTLYRPYLVERVGDETVNQPLAVAAFDFSDAVMQAVQDGMCEVVTNPDLGTAYAVFEGVPYTVCGKTGTAQSGRREPHGWFVAFAPADNPQVAVAAMVEYSREGSETAAPIVRRVLDAYFGAEPVGYPDWWNSGPYVPLEAPDGVSTGA